MLFVRLIPNAEEIYINVELYCQHFCLIAKQFAFELDLVNLKQCTKASQHTHTHVAIMIELVVMNLIVVSPAKLYLQQNKSTLQTVRNPLKNNPISKLCQKMKHTRNKTRAPRNHLNSSQFHCTNKQFGRLRSATRQSHSIRYCSNQSSGKFIQRQIPRHLSITIKSRGCGW